MKAKQIPQREQLLAAMAQGAATGRITASRLMSPAELTAVASNKLDLQGKVTGWHLCTQVPEGMWQRAFEARFEGVPHHLNIVEMGSGRNFMSIVIQMAEWQHRVCVPLFGRMTSQWVDTLVAGAPLQMSFVSPDFERAFSTVTDVPPGAIAALRDADTSVPKDWRELMDEAMVFLAWNSVVATSDQVGEMQQPIELSLSLLFPAEVEAELELLSGEAGGRKFS